LPKQFKVFGIIPEDELLSEKELKHKTGANFELISMKEFKKFIPLYAPTLIGVSRNRNIYFVLPGVPYAKEYLEQFLIDFYYKAYPLILEH